MLRGRTTPGRKQRFRGRQIVFVDRRAVRDSAILPREICFSDVNYPPEIFGERVEPTDTSKPGFILGRVAYKNNSGTLLKISTPSTAL